MDDGVDAGRLVSLASWGGCGVSRRTGTRLDCPRWADWGRFLPLGSCRHRLGVFDLLGEEFHQVVAACDQVPLTLGLFQAAKEHELALPGMDLTEHWFHDRFAPCINLGTVYRFQFPGHLLTQCGVGRERPV